MPIGEWFFKFFDNFTKQTQVIDDIMPISENEDDTQHVVEKLVNMVMSNTDKFTLRKIYTNNIKNSEITEEQAVNVLRPLNDLMTQFIVIEFFPTNSETEKFIRIVYDTFDSALKLYKSKKGLGNQDIFFVYKGGNILRYVAYEVMHEIGGEVANSINEHYKDSFKKSDADFSIYISPNLEDYDIIYNDMNILAYLLQTYLRDHFIKHQTTYFNFYKLSNQEKGHTLRKYLDKLNEIKPIELPGSFNALVINKDGVDINNNIVNLPFVPSPDFSIDYQMYNPQVMEKVELKSEDSMYRISSNRTLRFKSGEYLIRFSLVRTKVIFNAHFSNNSSNEIFKLGGELIDVSIPHREDTKLAHYFEHLNQNINNYDIKSESGNFVFKAPSLQYLIEDIEYILFDQPEFPWTDNKYEKRIRRLLFMYFINLLTNIRMGYPQKINYLTNVQKIFSKLTQNSNDNTIINDIDVFISQHQNEEKFPFKVLLLKLKGILQNANYDNTKLNEFAKLVYGNIGILIGFFQMIINKCSVSGLATRDILKSDTLWGGQNKYKKYKIKYLQEKKNK